MDIRVLKLLNFPTKFFCMTPIFYIIVVYNLHYICSTYAQKNITQYDEFINIYKINVIIIGIMLFIIVVSHFLMKSGNIEGENKNNNVIELEGKELIRATQDGSLAFYTSILSITFLTQPIDLWGFVFAMCLTLFIAHIIEFRTIFISNKILSSNLQIYEYDGYIFILKSGKYKQKIKFSYEKYNLVRTNRLKANGLFIIKEKNGK